MKKRFALTILLTSLCLSSSCVKRKTPTEIPSRQLKTGKDRDNGTNGRDKIMENSVFEAPNTQVADITTPSAPAASQATADTPSTPANTPPATTPATPPATTPTVPNPPPIPTTPPATNPGTPSKGGTTDKGGTPLPGAPVPGKTDPGAGTPTGVISKIPVRRVCSDKAEEKQGTTILAMNPSDLMVRLYPIQTAAPVSPITLETDGRQLITDIVNTGDIAVNVGGLPDGTYNIVLCNKYYGCDLTDLQRRTSDHERFQWNYRAELDRELARERAEGTPYFTREFGRDSKTFETYRQEMLYDRRGTMGGAIRIVLEQGRITFPPSSIIVRNQGLAAINSTSNATKADPIIAPQLIVAYDKARKRSKSHNYCPRAPQSCPKCNPCPNCPTECSPPPDGCDQTASPLIVDFANTGVVMNAPLDGVTFDLDADGALDRVSWPISADSAFVALDLNKNGQIDDGGELFGNYTTAPDNKIAANGFLALSKYDDNQDGLINAKDKVFADLKLWFDRNKNGKADAGELKTLPQASVESIEVGYEDIYEEDAYGNETRQRSVVHMTGNTLRMVFDIWLRRI